MASTLVAELKALRRGRGATEKKLQDSRHLSTLLLRRHPGVDSRRIALQAETRALGQNDHVAALAAAFGLGLADPTTLTTRRETAASLLGKSADTLEAWEDKLIEELAARLIGANGPLDLGDFQVVVEADYHRGVLRGAAVDRYVSNTATFDHRYDRAAVTPDSPEILQHSVPALVWRCPSDWQPQQVILLARFRNGHLPVAARWASVEAAPHGQELLHLLSFAGVQTGRCELRLLKDNDGLLLAHAWHDLDLVGAPLIHGLFWEY